MSLIHQGALSVYDYRCQARVGDKPFAESHESYSLAYVRKGAFGYRVGARHYDLVAGGMLVGEPGDEYRCSHDHVCGDECLSFVFAPQTIEQMGGTRLWRSRGMAPLAELMVLGELAQAAARGDSDMALDEVGLMLARRFLRLSGAANDHGATALPQHRRRAVQTALWIEQNCQEPIDLDAAASQAELSPFHFLRLFSRVLGVTPHQYLMRVRLRRAACLLAERERPITDIAFEVGFGDLSNFVRAFRRAAGISPRQFRKLSVGESKILQERLAVAA